MKKFGGVAAVAAGVMMLTGCGGSDAAPTRTVTQTETVTETATPSATETAATSGGLPLGEKVSLSAVDFTVSKVKKASSPYSELPADQQWWAVMVEGCPTAEDVSLSWRAWSITGADGGTYPASSSSWDDFPRPQYPFAGAKVIPNGKCAKGWMMIALNAGVEPASVDYGNSLGETATWKV